MICSTALPVAKFQMMLARGYREMAGVQQVGRRVTFSW